MFKSNLKKSLLTKIIAFVTIQAFIFSTSASAYPTLGNVSKVEKELRVTNADNNPATIKGIEEALDVVRWDTGKPVDWETWEWVPGYEGMAIREIANPDRVAFLNTVAGGFFSPRLVAMCTDGKELSLVDDWEYVPDSNTNKIRKIAKRAITRDRNPTTGLFEAEAIGGMATLVAVRPKEIDAKEQVLIEKVRRQIENIFIEWFRREPTIAEAAEALRIMREEAKTVKSAGRIAAVMVRNAAYLVEDNKRVMEVYKEEGIPSLKEMADIGEMGWKIEDIFIERIGRGPTIEEAAEALRMVRKEQRSVQEAGKIAAGMAKKAEILTKAEANLAKKKGEIVHRGLGGVNEAVDKLFAEGKMEDFTKVARKAIKNYLEDLPIAKRFDPNFQGDLLAFLPKMKFWRVKRGVDDSPVLVLENKDNYQVAHVGEGRKEDSQKSVYFSTLLSDLEFLRANFESGDNGVIYKLKCALLVRELSEQYKFSQFYDGRNYNYAVEEAEKFAEKIEKQLVGKWLNQYVQKKVDEFIKEEETFLAKTFEKNADGFFPAIEFASKIHRLDLKINFWNAKIGVEYEKYDGDNSSEPIRQSAILKADKLRGEKLDPLEKEKAGLLKKMKEHKLPETLAELYELNTDIANSIAVIAVYSEIIADRVEPDYLEIFRTTCLEIDSPAVWALFEDLKDMSVGKQSAYSDQFKKFAKNQIAVQKELLEKLYQNRENLKKQLTEEPFADDPFISCERLAFSSDGEPIDWTIWDWVPGSDNSKLRRKDNYALIRDINPITGLFEAEAIGGMATQYSSKEIGKLSHILLLGEVTNEERIKAMRNLARIGTPEAIEALSAVLDLNKNKRLNSQEKLSPYEVEAEAVLEECIKLLAESGGIQAVDSLIKFGKEPFHRDTAQFYSIKGSIAPVTIDNALLSLSKKDEVRTYLAKLYCESKDEDARSVIYHLAHPVYPTKEKAKIAKSLNDEIFLEKNGYPRMPKKRAKTVIFVEGNVIGVGFRGYATDIPDRLWLDLDVKAENLRDGRVKITIKGSDEEVEKFIAYLPSAQISRFTIKSKGKFNKSVWEMTDDDIKSLESIKDILEKTISTRVPFGVLPQLYKLSCASSNMLLNEGTKEWLKEKVKEKLVIEEGIDKNVVDSLVSAISSGKVEQWAKDTSANLAKKKGEITHRGPSSVNEAVDKAFKEGRTEAYAAGTRIVKAYLNKEETMEKITKAGIKDFKRDLFSVLPSMNFWLVKNDSPTLVIENKDNYQLAHQGLTKRYAYLSKLLNERLAKDNHELHSAWLVREAVALYRALELYNGSNYDYAVEEAEKFAKKVEKALIGDKLDEYVQNRVDDFIKEEEAFLAKTLPHIRAEYNEKKRTQLKDKANARAVIIDAELLAYPGLPEVLYINKQLGKKFVLAIKDPKKEEALYRGIKKATHGRVDLKGVFEMTVLRGENPKEVINKVQEELKVEAVEVIGQEEWAQAYHTLAKTELADCIVIICKVEEGKIIRGDTALWVALNALVDEQILEDGEAEALLHYRKDGALFVIEAEDIGDKVLTVFNTYHEVVLSE